MTMQPLEAFRQFRAHHLRALTGECQTILRGRLSGQPVSAIADDLLRSTASVRREIESIQDAIFIPLCLERDQWATAFWVSAHLECCVRDFR